MSNISRSRETKMPATESLTDFEQKYNAEDNISEMKNATENSSKILSNCEESNFDLANDATNEFDFNREFYQNTIRSSSFNQLDQFPKSSSSLDYFCQLKAVIDKVNKLQIDPFVDIYSLTSEGRGVSAAAMSRNMCHLAYSHPHSHELHLFAQKSLPSYIARSDARLTWINFKSAKNKKTDEEKEKISHPRVHVIGHNDVSGLCFSSCDNLLLSCSLDGSVKVIGTTTYCVLQKCRGDGSATAIDVNPRTINFVTANVLPSDPFHTMHLYNFERNEPVQHFYGHEGSIKCVQFHPNGIYFATAASDKSIKLWSFQQGAAVRCFKDERIDHPNTITFSSDGAYIASTHSRCVKIWDIASQTEVRCLDISNSDPHILNVCYDASGNILAAGGTDNKIHIWDVKSDEKSETVPNYRLLKSECIGKRIFSMRFSGTVLSCLTE